MSKIAICGDIHGHFDRMYDKARELGADIIIQVGDIGIFPDPTHLDAATKRHNVPPDFLRYFRQERTIPIPTFFIKGNHEDFDFLEGKEGEIVPNLFYMPQQTVFTIERIRFGALGGNYSPAYHQHQKLTGGRRRHFTATDILSIQNKGFDVLISHHGPKTDLLPQGSQEITDLIKAVQPSHAYHGHHHHFYKSNIENTTITGLSNLDSSYPAMILHDNNSI